MTRRWLLVLVVLAACEDEPACTGADVAYCDPLRPMPCRVDLNGARRKADRLECPDELACEEADGHESWPLCSSACSGLDEQRCIDQAGCQAIYSGSWTGVGVFFDRCLATAQPTGTPPPCDGLAAQACSTWDHCSASYYQSRGQLFIPFAGCRVEAFCGRQPPANENNPPC